MGKKLGMLEHMCHPTYGGKPKMGGLQSRMARAKSKSLFPK
jgi:hypothetical protein